MDRSCRLMCNYARPFHCVVYTGMHSATDHATLYFPPKKEGQMALEFMLQISFSLGFLYSRPLSFGLLYKQGLQDIDRLPPLFIIVFSIWEAILRFQHTMAIGRITVKTFHIFSKENKNPVHFIRTFSLLCLVQFSL